MEDSKLTHSFTKVCSFVFTDCMVSISSFDGNKNRGGRVDQSGQRRRAEGQKVRQTHPLSFQDGGERFGELLQTALQDR